MAQNNKKKQKRAPAYSADGMVVCLIMGLLLMALGVLIFLANVIGMQGDVFAMLRDLTGGMTGSLALVVGALAIWGGILTLISTQRKPPLRPFLLALIMAVFACTAATLFTFVGGNESLPDYIGRIIGGNGTAQMNLYLSQAFKYGQHGWGGGFIGMVLGYPLWKGLGAIGGGVVSVIGAVIAFLFMVRVNFKGLFADMKRRGNERRTRQQAEAEQERQQALLWQQQEMARRQEQHRMQQEMMRQQLMQQQMAPQQMQQPAQPIYQQPVYDPNNQGVPIVKQGSRQQQNAQAYGFQPTPEELGQVDAPQMAAPQMTAPQPLVRPDQPKKRGGVFDRSKGGDAKAAPRKRKFDFFGRGDAAEDAEDESPVLNQQAQQAVMPAADLPEPVQAAPQEPMRRKGATQPMAPVFISEQPEEAFPYPPAEDAFTPEPAPVHQVPVQAAAPKAATAPQHVAKPAAAPSMAPSAPVKAPAAPVQPAAVPVQTAPVHQRAASAEAAKAANPNSFLARLRQAKRDAGIEVPEDDIPVRAPIAEDAEKEDIPAPIAAPARPVARKAEPKWEDIPPWDDAVAEPQKPRGIVMPVVTAAAPDGGYEPELNLKPQRNGKLPSGPIIEKAPEVPYVFPPMDLIKSPDPQSGISEEEDAIRTRRLENTLQSFRVPAKVRHITHGPAISRFELELAAGIKVSKVTDLNRNIAMNMEVKTVRIEAPIPGKSLVGVEVPNKTRTNVTLKEVLESDVMRKATKPLVVALGKDIAGAPIICDLAKMPHLLIAGATGSGKSVCVNTIINSLLYRCSPKDVRLILVDPKVVELQCYNGIPHLLIPVVTDPHKASGALAWAVGEMMDRYKRFEMAGVRAIDGYNENLPDGEEKMPRIVIIIDELADLMLTCKKDVEERICRIAQLARAAGIHLIVATQRPSVDVITGTIKANIPSRIAFKVSSNVDSRTILDRQGAEQLLGYGDMLYMPTGEFTPIRVQGCFLSDPEVNRITDFIRENCPSDYDPAVLEELERLESDSEGGMPTPVMPTGDENPNSDASLISQCIEMAVMEGQLSTSTIQRRLKLGYARAGRLMDELEDRGIVTSKDGSKPRECRISREEFEAMKAAGELD